MTINITDKELLSKLDEFIPIYEARPIRGNFGGMGITHSFYLWFLAKKLNPKFIIESGIWYGHTTWLLETSCPNAKVHSIDPYLSQRKYISDKVTYYDNDFSKIDWSMNPKETFILFDDHYGTDRLFQAHSFGFSDLFFDDNYCDHRGQGNHPNKNAKSPKFALSENSEETEELRKIIDIYYEFPPVYETFNDKLYNRFGISESNIKQCTKEPLTSNCHQLYKEDACWYTWPTYIKLKNRK